MNDLKELQKAFMAYLILDAAALGIELKSEADLQAYAEKLGQEGLKQKYLEFMGKMQGGIMAKLGAKLEYYKKLKGECPEGEELVFMQKGGRICKVCQKKKEMALKGLKLDPVQEYKKGRQLYKKDMSTAKDEAARDSIAINKYNDEETMIEKWNRGKMKKGTWVPDRTKYPKKEVITH